MDLRQEILREHNKNQITKIVQYIGNSSERFAWLVDIFLEGPYRVTQRAAWPLAYCVENYPELIEPHLKSVLDHLKEPHIHDAVKRNTMKLLQFIEIPKRLQGQVANICFGYLNDKKEPIAVKVFSMSVLNEIASLNPELKQELRIIIEDHLPYASPAFRSRAKKVLKTLNQK